MANNRMNTSSPRTEPFRLLAFATLVVGIVPASGADRPAPDAAATAAATEPAPINRLFEAPLKWKSSGVLIQPVSDETHEIVSVKDPTIVRYQDRWHIYATAYSTSAKTWSMVYLNFKDWADAPTAPLF